MITYEIRTKAINEIRLVMRNPIEALKLLKELKHGSIPTYSFLDIPSITWHLVRGI